MVEITMACLHKPYNDTEINVINQHQCIFLAVKKSATFLIFSVVGGLLRSKGFDNTFCDLFSELFGAFGGEVDVLILLYLFQSRQGE
jgi:hypothetical protein